MTWFDVMGKMTDEYLINEFLKTTLQNLDLAKHVENEQMVKYYNEKLADIKAEIKNRKIEME